jgi:hypothetical protein
MWQKGKHGLEDMQIASSNRKEVYTDLNNRLPVLGHWVKSEGGTYYKKNW